MRLGSVFSGIGAMEAGFEEAGFKTVWQIETGKYQTQVLERHFPYAKRFGDIRGFADYDLDPIDIIIGGDPCPKHSRARSNGASVHPDLAGYFLALVGRLRPEWVVRENVPAPTIGIFDAALAYLGYGTIIVRVDAAESTGQSRQRDFVVGRYQATRTSVRDIFHDCPDGPGHYSTRLGSRSVIPALTAHRTRYDSRDCYIWEPQAGIFRILDGDERDGFTGLPAGWTAGLSERQRAIMCGNAVARPVAYFIAKRIIDYERGES